MKYEEFSENGKLIMDQLIAIHGPSVAFRLYGIMEYARQNPDLALREPASLWQDVTLLKKAGLYPQNLKPAQLGDWTRWIFSVNLMAALVIAKIVPVDQLVGQVTEKELAVAREMLKNYRLKQLVEPVVEKDHQVWPVPK